MSLQLAAQHMASRGRGPDTTLVHMAPQEVAGLQALAKAHGGSLTVNPDTGLPEAGFLSSLLPTLIGAGLSMIPGVGPLMAAGIVGGGTAMATGSLQKGLMAGLGAYGGAGIAGSLAGAGTAAGLGAAGAEAAAAGELAAANAAPAITDITSNMANVAATEGAGVAGAGLPTGASSSLPNTFNLSSGYEVGVPTQAANMVPVSTPLQAGIPAPIPAPTSYVDQLDQMRAAGFSDADIAQSAKEFASNQAGNASAPFTQATQDALKSPFSAGIDAVKENPDLLFNKGNLKYAMAAGLPLLMQDPKKVEKKPEEKPWMYSYAPGRVEDVNAGYKGAFTGERTHFNPVYTRTAAGGGLMDLGPVQAMSDRNESQTLMANNGQMFAAGGQISLQGTFDVGGGGGGFGSQFGQAGSNSYTPVGGGFGGNQMAAPAVMPSKNPFEGDQQFAKHMSMMDQMQKDLNGTEQYKSLQNQESVMSAYEREKLAGFNGKPNVNPFEGDQQWATHMSTLDKLRDDMMGTDQYKNLQNQQANMQNYYQPYSNRGLSQDLRPGDSQYGSYMKNRVSGFGAGFAEGGETKAVKPVEENPYYTMSGQSGDAFKYLMGQMPESPKAPAPVVAAPVQSTVQPTASEKNGLMDRVKNLVFGNAFGGLGQQPMSPEAQAAGGEWVDDTSGLIKPYDFDVNTGTWSAKAAPKVWRPYAPPATTTTWDMGGGMAQGGIASLAQGGQSHLGDYSDGGRLLKGPGDGVSDSIPATIANKRPARLADGEFVVPARIVSELGNGSTEAGARKLYAMMDRVQNARKKSIGKDRVAVNSRSEKLLPA